MVRHIDDLRAAMKTVKNAHPFAVLAMVVLFEHLHAIWRLPSDDADYPTALVAHQGRILAAAGKRRAYSCQLSSQA
ncbi:protein of unknown function [Candidatus Nitrotoga arctica]|uniref:Uncharacterized protein n=1 Tax=Candidatus Nitrotoga arctica TaxID=453162 RepID=A0ABN8AI92_9PROT|nr:protein of unknown function [Candidatus Nitrotoga arctica]